MPAQPGTRVIAIRNADESGVYIYGRGIYEGVFVPSQDPDGFDWPIPSPKIKLDNGKVVWGAQCWWGREDAVLERFAGRPMIEVPLE
jgi:hypothetical protein